MKLGDMIEWIEAWEKLHPNKAEEVQVYYDFARLVPDGIGSWRGIYAELAIGWTDDDSAGMTVAQFKALLQGAVGETYFGYKGGEYKMDHDTEVHVDNYGRWTSTDIIGISDETYRVTICTARDAS